MTRAVLLRQHRARHQPSHHARHHGQLQAVGYELGKPEPNSAQAQSPRAKCEREPQSAQARGAPGPEANPGPTDTPEPRL